MLVSGRVFDGSRCVTISIYFLLETFQSTGPGPLSSSTFWSSEVMVERSIFWERHLICRKKSCEACFRTAKFGNLQQNLSLSKDLVAKVASLNPKKGR